MQHASEFRLNDVGLYVPYVMDNDGTMREVAWAPLPGSQEAFLKVPEVECLNEGTRGSAKTVGLLMDFTQHCGQGFGEQWKGIIFRPTHPQLSEVISLSKQWIKQICPDAEWNEMKSTWRFSGGESLRFAHFPDANAYNDYLGHSYGFIGWEELTLWGDDGAYRVMFACSRSAVKGMPRKVRATTNPYGVGRSWVMQRFRLPLPPGTTIGPAITDSLDEKGHLEPPRRVIHSHLDENLPLMAADPDYKQRISAAARNESERAAWLLGDWNIVSGGMFSDIWYETKKWVVVPDFQVPETWRLFRAYDHGSSKPYAVGWFARANGDDIVFNDGRIRSTLKGDIYLVGEMYGMGFKPDVGLRLPIAEISRRIRAYEESRGWAGRVRPGPADTSIFDSDDSRPSVATDFERAGVEWLRADKGPGSRMQGWEQLRKRFLATQRVDGVRETPGFYVVGERCPQWLRTVPALPRDDKNMDDVDSKSEDHMGDMTRYALRWDSSPNVRSFRLATA